MNINIKNPTNRNLKILHKKLWLWLADNPSKQKSDWPGWIQFETNPKFHTACRLRCFACQEHENRKGRAIFSLGCSNCPIKWKVPEDEANHCNSSLITEYPQWKNASTFCERSAWATKIANLYWSDKGAK